MKQFFLKDESPTLTYFERKRLIKYGHKNGVDKFSKKILDNIYMKKILLVLSSFYLL